MLLFEGEVAVGCTHLMVEVVEYVAKEPHLDVVASMVMASTSGLAAEMQAVLELQDRLLLPDNSRNEECPHLWWILEVDQAD